MKKAIIIIMFLVYMASVSASAGITNIGNQWMPVKATGEESQLTFWKLNNDKKTELGWIPPNNSCIGWTDKTIYDRNNQPIKNDKNKDIAIKCESAKCYGQSCYHISLTTVQAVNIDDYMKLGNQSFTVEYQNQSKIEYFKEHDEFDNETNTTYTVVDYNVNITLKKNIAGNFIINPDDIFIFPRGTGIKFGANDSANTGIEQYRYEFESNKEIWEHDGKYFIGGRFIQISTGVSDRGYTIEAEEIDLQDICDEQDLMNPVHQCSFSLTSNSQCSDMDCTAPTQWYLNVTFFDDSFIDPVIGTSNFSQITSVIWHNNTNITGGNIQLISLSSNGTAEKSVELKDYIPYNSTGLIGHWIKDYTDARDESNNSNNGVFEGGLASCNNYAHYGYACDFDGINDYINITQNTNFNFGNGTTDRPFTVCGWANSDDLTNMRIVSKYTSEEGFVWFLNIAGDDKLYFSIHDNNETATGYERIVSSGPLTSYQGKDIFICGVYTALSGGESASNDMTLYLNGEVLSSVQSDGAGIYVAMENIPVSLQIGKLATSFANGLISNVQIYNRSLSEDEIWRNYIGNRSGRYLYNATSDYQDKSPVLTLHFDKDSQVQKDSSGFGNDGVVYNATFNSSGYYGSGYNFDFNNSYIEIPDSPSLSFGNAGTDNPFSISFWAYNRNYSALPYVLENYISKDGVDNLREWTVYLYQGELGFALYSKNGTNRIVRKGSFTVPLDTWFYVTATYDGSKLTSGIKVYVNGTRIDASNDTFGNYASLNDGSNPVRIGRGNVNTAPTHFNGTIDEINIFPRELTQAEISDIYANGTEFLIKKTNVTMQVMGTDSVYSHAISNTTGLVAGWDFEQNTTAVGGIKDFSGSGNNGTMYGSIFKNVTGNDYLEDGYYAFDGTNDYELITKTQSFNLNQGTISAWVKLKSVGKTHSLFSLGESSTNYEAYVGFSTTNALRWYIANVSYIIIGDTLDTLSTDVWHHIAVTVDSSGNKLYIDGVQRSVSYIFGSSTTNSFLNEPYDEATQVYIGRHNYAVNPAWFNGSIDEVHVYNRSLSAQEIWDNYNRGNYSGKTYGNPDSTQAYKFIKWKADLKTNNVSFTPTVDDITLQYLDIASYTPNLPNVTIISPQDGSTWYSWIIDLWVSATGTITNWWYNIDDGANISFTPNTTINVTSAGTYNLTVYANDTGNIGFNTSTFTVSPHKKWVVHSQYYPYNVTWIDETGEIWTYGDILALGNATINIPFIYAWNFTDGGYTFTISSSSTYYNFTNWVLDGSNAFSFSGYTFKALISGHYEISFDSSMSCGVNGEYGIGLSKNGASPEGTQCYTHFEGSGSHDSTEFNCALSISTSDNLTLVMDDEAFPPQDCNIIRQGLLIKRIAQ